MPRGLCRRVRLWEEKRSVCFGAVCVLKAPLFIMQLLRIILIPAAGPFEPAEAHVDFELICGLE